MAAVPRPPALARHPWVAAMALVVGLGLLATAVPALLGRLTTWSQGQRVSSTGTVVRQLDGGDQLIFEVCSDVAGPCPDVHATDVTVTDLATGAAVATRDDPSEDRDPLTADGNPLAPTGNLIVDGAVSFTTPHPGRYRIAVAGPPRRRLLVTLSPGAFVRQVSGWLALGVASLLLFLGAALCLLVAAVARRRRRRRGAVAAPSRVRGPVEPVSRDRRSGLREGQNPRIVS